MVQTPHNPLAVTPYDRDGAPAPTGGAASPLSVTGLGFDLAKAPAVTAGAYSAGDIIGGLIEFEVGRANGGFVLLHEVQVTFKPTVQSNLRVVVLNADPTSTTTTDNEAFDLDADDAFKVRLDQPIYGFGDTPKTMRFKNLDLLIRCAPTSKSIYLLVVTDTGITLTSTSDLQVSITGVY